LRDPDGNEYVYFIKEVDVPGYKPVGYYLESGTSKTVNSTELAENSTKHFAIHNAEDSSNSTTLPESGGTGTRIYYTIGAMLLLLAAAGYWAYSIKRRRWYDE
jgi:LPXTG-motif cell wall-anchored protein